MAFDLTKLHPTNQQFLARRAGGEGLLADGQWKAARDGKTFDTVDPATGAVTGKLALANSADVDDAVAAARGALADWKNTTPVNRSKILWAIADIIEENIDALAELESLDQGKPLYVGRWAELPGAVNQFRFFAGQAMNIEGQTLESSIDYQPAGKQMRTWTAREPVGVVAAIVPWNSPLVLTAMKLAPALAAGCTIVLKPAEDTSLTALRLAELMSEAGLPDGVLNVITGFGAETGASLAAHAGVDKIAFTGSTATGRAILDAAKTNFKRVTLELGGKSPCIVMDDADLELAIPGVANAIFFNSGQVCIAGSRLYAHSAIYDRLVAGVVEYAKGLKMGHGLDPESQMGPLVSLRQAERVEGFIQRAQADGATLLAGGERSGEAGTFISPTVLADVSPDMEIVCEEVFGPVLAVQKFDDVDEVIAAANDSDFGLAASVWTESLSNAHRMSSAIRAGTVWINCHAMYDPSLAIGGVKQSGWGRDSGKQAMDNYLEWKTVCAAV
ncbi:aldehyde dehydrogenase family protein [Sphingorhabdus sp. SMR4y]|uniref:aldehyde dehydrogenase family protein n=1 Tax=Sphingorhabdus sp. SMR4y TaxID=2584094 RepID=UPI000B5CA60E|nr:aldehyde dehydrogenase family protein [Sphingorhabdus sp. SMR4y]ASK89357.1 NAD-dependent succinate-semialdehyde dehydrogenase [Sphingorhabdus sp. SMR4y]